MTGVSGAPGNPGATAVTFGTYYTAPSLTAPTLAQTPNGFSFDRWWNSQANAIAGTTGEVTTGTLMTNPAAHDIFARWLPTENSITFSHRGTTGGPVTTISDTFAHINGTPLPASVTAPERPGFTFGGWFDSPANADGGTTGMIFNTSGERTFTTNWLRGTGNAQGTLTTQLYARWTPLMMEISFARGQDAQGGTTSLTHTIGTHLPLSITTPTRLGWMFDGYFLDAQMYFNSSGARTMNNLLYSPTPLGEGASGRGITLTAQWTARSFNIQFDLDGGNVEGATGIIPGSELGFAVHTNNTPLPPGGVTPPRMHGYRFLGFFEGLSPIFDRTGTRITNNPFMFYDDVSTTITLLAHWEEALYNITFNPNQGRWELPPYDNASTIIRQVTYGDPLIDIPPDPVRALFRFVHWALPSSITSEFPLGQAFDFATQITGQLTIFAIWEPDIVTITLTNPDGTYVEYSFDAGTLFIPAIPPRPPGINESYVFLGWALSHQEALLGDITLVHLFPYEAMFPSTHITLYATWGPSDPYWDIEPPRPPAG